MKKLNANVKKIYLVQYNDEYNPDVLAFILDAPTHTPSEPENEPFLIAYTEPGYGGVWLKEAFNLQPDEVINPENMPESFPAALKVMVEAVKEA